MSVNSGAENTSSKAKTPKRRGFIWLIIILTLALSFGYFTYLNLKDNATNNDFYRVLYEASNSFNENLSKMASLHQFKESETSIRSLLPSYQRISDDSLNEKHRFFNYELTGQKINITSEPKGLGESPAETAPNSPQSGNNVDTNANITLDQIGISQSSTSAVENMSAINADQNHQSDTETLLSRAPSARTGAFKAQLNIEDVLPEPGSGFSQLIFANDQGKVLATSGSEKTISIIDLSSINQEFMRQAKRSLLSSQESSDSQNTGDAPLPSYSSHIDMQLSYGDFRIYVFPFPLTTLLTVQGDNHQTTVVDRLYLIGLLPKDQLLTRGTGQWNLSVLFVSLVSLVFMWALVRLYLLPKTHSITRLYRNITHISSYAFFIVVVAMLLAFLQRQVMQHNKDQAAKGYAQQLSTGLNGDLLNVFRQLEGYRSFYQILLTSLETDSPQTDKWIAGSSYRAATDNDAHKGLNERLNQAISSTVKPGCNKQLLRAGLLPSFAATQSKLYDIKYHCEQNSSGDDLWQANLTLDKTALDIIKSAHQINQQRTDTLDFYAGNLKINIKQNEYVETYVDAADQDYQPSMVLNVFSLNDQGNSVLPSFYFLENNAFPATFNLSHRDYYKKIRDQKGWDLNLNQEWLTYPLKDVYIQRLLNINNGTRGTTISMPLYDSSDSGTQRVSGHVVAADVLLPTVSLAPPAPYDFTYMLVDRDSGDVLFHSDESRSLIENLYFSGNSQSHLSQWIKAGLDYYPDVDGDNIIKGVYHGDPGRFIMQPSAVDSWAILVFYPDDSLDSLMTSQFMFISVSFALTLTLLAVFSFLLGYLFNTAQLKKICSLPATFDSKEMLHMCSILLAIIYALHSLAQLLKYAAPPGNDAELYPDILPLAALLIIFYFGYKGYQQLFETAGVNYETNHMGRNGAIVMACGLALLAITQLGYLRTVMDMPLKSLGFYYQQQYCNRINRELNELNNTGLSRYPNSITQQRIAAIDLLPLDKSWHPRLADLAHTCAQHSRAVEPKDYPKLSSLIGAIYGWQWINTYLLTSLYLDDVAIPHTATDPIKIRTATAQGRTLTDPAASKDAFQLPVASLIGSMLSVAILIWIWLHFNRHVLWYRLYCSQFFLKYIKQISSSVNSLANSEMSDKLRIEVDTIKPNGLGLTFLLRSINHGLDSGILPHNMLPGFERLYALSPLLQHLLVKDIELPNVKLHLTQVEDGELLEVELWDLEVCLELPELRGILLSLIMELKFLALAGHMQRLTIFSSFYSLQRVKMKDPIATHEDSAKLKHADYLSWSDCLADFTVVLPQGLTQELDCNLLKSEIDAFPELNFLRSSLNKLSPKPNKQITTKPGPSSWWTGIRRQRVWHKSSQRWATINFILLHCGALYRFKWESCSNAEKLALFNLAKKQRINPTNTEMIEQLALSGLLRVEQQHIRIINESFAHFVLHAESPEVLSQLVSDGEAGTWKNYRLLVGLLILLVVGGIALTSGESIYIIAASLAGVVGTIASVTNSANLLKGQFKD